MCNILLFSFLIWCFSLSESKKRKERNDPFPLLFVLRVYGSPSFSDQAPLNQRRSYQHFSERFLLPILDKCYSHYRFSKRILVHTDHIYQESHLKKKSKFQWGFKLMTPRISSGRFSKMQILLCYRMHVPQLFFFLYQLCHHLLLYAQIPHLTLIFTVNVITIFVLGSTLYLSIKRTFVFLLGTSRTSIVTSTVTVTRSIPSFQTAQNCTLDFQALNMVGFTLQFIYSTFQALS